MSFLGDLFDPAGALATGGNNNTFDSVFSPADNLLGQDGFNVEPSFLNDFQSNVADPISNFGDGVVDANLDELRNLGNHFGKNPAQVFYSGADPFSTKVWNGVTGQHNTPFLNTWGGETNQDFQNSANRGVNTEGHQYLSALANAIAGYQAGSWAGNAASSAWAGAGLGSGAGSTVGGTGVNAGADAGMLDGTVPVGTGANAGFAEDVANAGGDASAWGGGAYGTPAAGAGGATTGLSSDTVGASARGAVNPAANALNNNQNPFKAAARGGATGGLSSGIDVAGISGVDDPQYKAVLNNTFNGAASAGINGGKMDNGAVMGMLSGLGNAYGTPAMNWLTSTFGGNTTPGTSGANSGGMNNLGNLAAGLGSLYLAQKAKNANNAQINNLNSLYSPNSPYAQQMQQALDRQDAASGRRSQYGTRQVELQARLAQLNSQNAPMLNQLNQQKRNIDFGQLASLYQMGKNTGMFGNGAGGLGGMYQIPQDYSQGPAMTSNSQLSTYNPTADVNATMPNVNFGGGSSPNWYDQYNSPNYSYGG